MSEAPKWIILWRQKVTDDWQPHRHHKGTIFKFSDLDKTAGDVRRMKARGLQAMAVREDRCYPAYGVLV